MNIGTCYFIIIYKLTACIPLDMVFISIKCFIIFFRPTGIDILMRQLFLVPCTWNYTFFVLLIFFSAITLTRYFMKTCIYHFPLGYNHLMGCQHFIKPVEQFLFIIIYR